MKFLGFLTSSILAGTLAISQGLFLSSKAQVTRKPRPLIVLVDGWLNCCVQTFNGLEDLGELRITSYSRFANGSQSSPTDNDEAFLIEGKHFINNRLDIERPLIFIGHSFGGDSILKLLPRINRRVQFVGVIDPVTTGGWRRDLIKFQVPKTVDYFYNRWQENSPFPNDFKNSGWIYCVAAKCDQDSQNIQRRADSSPYKDKCAWLEITCSTKQRRVGHQTIAYDEFVHEEVRNKIKQSLDTYWNSNGNSLVFNADYYLANNPDLRNSFGDNREKAEFHWIMHGISEGRQGSPRFSTKCYLNRYADLKNAFGTDYTKALRHYIESGIREGRNGAC
jgi:hypothetical protein